MATKTLLTVEDFLRLPEPLDCSYELVEGELITVSPTTPEHNDVRDTILVALLLPGFAVKVSSLFAQE